MHVNGMPWQADVNMKASEAAALLNAIPMALAWMHEQELEENIEAPDDLPTIRHRMAHCVFVEDVEMALDCIDDDEECPADYKLGGVSQTVPPYLHANSTAYFEKLWEQFDQAIITLDDQGVTPKPVAMITSVYSGNLEDGFMETVIGYTGSIGDLRWSDSPHRLGGTIVESDYFQFPNVAHELGHALGLSHVKPYESPVGLVGFMKDSWPFPLLAILGPSKSSTDGYGGTNQWLNWSFRIGNKTIPRPNAFGWAGCVDDNDCPNQLECWFFVANTPGVCREPQ